LWAHPGDPEGQSLLRKEYLASQKLGEMTDEEKERLRVIRVARYARERRDRTEHEPSIREDDGKREGGAKQSEVGGATLAVLHTQAKLASLENPWSGEPKTIIDGMIDDMPDDVPVYTMDTLHLMPKNEPSQLELFLLSKVRTLPEFTQGKTEGALRVMESIACLRDQVRTKKFLLGIKDSVKDLDTPENATINMCDAGTGALPILAIYAALCSDKVRCTALELNPNSARVAREVVTSFGLEDRIKVVETDATKFKPDAPLDFLVSETMHSGLTQEPIVQILANLQPQVKEGGVIMPSGITVQAGLVRLEDFVQPRGFVKIGDNMHHVVEPAWQEVVNYTSGDGLEEINFSLPTTDSSQGDYMIAVTSTVDVGLQHLDSYQSLITMPQYVCDSKGDPQLFKLTGNEKQGLEVQYKPGDMLNGVGRIVNKS